MKQIPIGLVGYGTVGQGVAAILNSNGQEIASRLGAQPALKHIVEKYPDRQFDIPPPEGVITSDLQVLLDDPEVEIAIELVGGTDVARQIVAQLLKAGKHVVTANKALLAHHGPELFKLARQNNRCIAFEASCGGGIPLTESIRRGLAANRITAIYGILNGTCNYILTEMTRKGKSYQQALQEAQAAGYAEADPTLDVDGTDSAHKLAILSSMAFQLAVPLAAISIAGIDQVSLEDIRYGQELGYTMKLLTIGVNESDGVSVRVGPAFIHSDHPLAWISGSFNAVSIYGNAVGHTMYYGRGAGRMPTASAVLADVIDIAIGNAQRTFDQLAVLPDLTNPAVIKPIEQTHSRYYFRLMAVDKPGVLAKVTEIFGKEQISISAVIQHEAGDRPTDGPEIVPVVILSHTAREGNVRTALKQISQLDVIAPQPVCIPVVDQHPEWQE